MTHLCDKLSVYGVNIPVVMERFVNDEELYYSCLCTFMEDSSFEGLNNALHNKDYTLAFDCAHTLKGVTANLGLEPLLEVICSIVESLRHNDYSHLQEQYCAIISEREKLRNILEI